MRSGQMVAKSGLVGIVATLGLGSVPLPAGPAGAAVFVGSTPCDARPRKFVGIDAASACERITWQLTFSTDELTRRPTTFSLVAVYGLSAQRAPGFVDSGTEVRLQGIWSIVKGAATGSQATAYRITAEKPQRTLHLALVSDNLLHPLNDDKSLMLGNASWSYTLSRMNAAPQTSRSVNGGLQRVSATNVTAGSAGSNITGIFDGRTPCQELARQLNVQTSSACDKIKWRLTLYQDPKTGAPATYKLEGFVYRNPPRSGDWTIRKAATDMHALVYQLDPDEGGEFLSFFKADEDVLFMLNKEGDFLVGNIHYSYTLNRRK